MEEQFKVVLLCLSRWPLLCDQLLRSLTRSRDDDDDDDHGDGVDLKNSVGALSSVERLLALSDDAVVASGAVGATSRHSSVPTLLDELLDVLTAAHDAARRCERDAAELLARGDVAAASAVRGSSWLSLIDAVTLLREVAMHFETDYQLRVDLARRFAQRSDADERQVLRLAWLALPTPVPAARRFAIAQQLQEIVKAE
jgi:hypothetical protein